MKKTKENAVNVDNDVDERMVPSKHKGSGIYGEHIARYEAATGIVTGKRVLDIASGSGYGTALLAQYAEIAVGVDVSAEAINFSKREYKLNNTIFKKSNGKTIPYNDNEFDVVVSFETIEHLEDVSLFMDEVKRVLKDDGIFILSTPNEKEFSEGNHFHLHEFQHDELLKLAKKYYKNVEQYYQATWVGNLIGSQSTMTKEWRGDIAVQQLNPIKKDKFLYFYFLCSNRSISEVVETSFTISQHSSDRTINEKNVLTQNHIKNLEKLILEYKNEQMITHALLESYQNSRSVQLLRKGKSLFKK